MFERLIDLVIDFLGLFKFFAVLDEYEQGVVLTWGRPRNRRFLGLFGSHLLGPGFHWVWPFGIEKVLSDNVVPTTKNLEPQSLTTRDGVGIVVSAAITWKIKNIRKMLLEVENPDEALQDSTYGAIGQIVESSTWAEICQPEFSENLAKAIRRKAFRWGIEVDEVYIVDKTKSLSLRLIQSGNGKLPAK